MRPSIDSSRGEVSHNVEGHQFHLFKTDQKQAFWLFLISMPKTFYMNWFYVGQNYIQVKTF